MLVIIVVVVVGGVVLVVIYYVIVGMHTSNEGINDCTASSDGVVQGGPFLVQVPHRVGHGGRYGPVRRQARQRKGEELEPVFQELVLHDRRGDGFEASFHLARHSRAPYELAQVWPHSQKNT